MCYYFIIYYPTDYVEIFTFDTALEYFLATFQVFLLSFIYVSPIEEEMKLCVVQRSTFLERIPVQNLWPFLRWFSLVSFGFNLCEELIT